MSFYLYHCGNSKITQKVKAYLIDRFKSEQKYSTEFSSKDSKEKNGKTDNPGGQKRTSTGLLQWILKVFPPLTLFVLNQIFLNISVKEKKSSLFSYELR